MFERTKLGPVAKNAISSADNECIDANEFSHESIANESPLPMSHHCQWVTISVKAKARFFDIVLRLYNLMNDIQKVNTNH